MRTELNNSASGMCHPCIAKSGSVLKKFAAFLYYVEREYDRTSVNDDEKFGPTRDGIMQFIIFAQTVFYRPPQNYVHLKQVVEYFVDVQATYRSHTRLSAPNSLMNSEAKSRAVIPRDQNRRPVTRARGMAASLRNWVVLHVSRVDKVGLTWYGKVPWR